MDRPITLTDVAKEAGVAVGTASRVLNNVSNVNPESRRRVMEVVARLNYRRLRMRRNSRFGGQRGGETPCNIGLVLLGMDETLVHVPVLSAVLHGVESAVTGMNGNLLFANVPKGDSVPAFFKSGQVSGLIVKTSQYGALPHPDSNPLIKGILRLPVVWVWAKPEGAPGDVCSFNHETAAQLVAKHLAERGHRRVAYVNPKKGKTSLEHIKKQFQFSCETLGLELTLIESGSDRVARWPEPALTRPDELLPLIDQWMAISKERRPTAFFVPADNISLQVSAALQQRGLRAGRDISLISLNNESSLVQAMNPTLTTVDVNAQRIGARCVEQLLWRVDHPGDTVSQTILLEPFLVPGASVVQL
ncbi:MAG: LacI family DNA-binding transcriptional regulator [Opitutaceae bacterium]